jgi:hypothetical protein
MKTDHATRPPTKRSEQFLEPLEDVAIVVQKCRHWRQEDPARRMLAELIMARVAVEFIGLRSLTHRQDRTGANARERIAALTRLGVLEELERLRLVRREVGNAHHG